MSRHSRAWHRGSALVADPTPPVHAAGKKTTTVSRGGPSGDAEMLHQIFVRSKAMAHIFADVLRRVEEVGAKVSLRHLFAVSQRHGPDPTEQEVLAHCNSGKVRVTIVWAHCEVVITFSRAVAARRNIKPCDSHTFRRQSPKIDEKDPSL